MRVTETVTRRTTTTTSTATMTTTTTTSSTAVKWAFERGRLKTNRRLDLLLIKCLQIKKTADLSLSDFVEHEIEVAMLFKIKYTLQNRMGEEKTEKQNCLKALKGQRVPGFLATVALKLLKTND